MNSLKLAIRQSAYEDLEAIWEYTMKTWSIYQADKYYSEIITAFELICKNPSAGKSAHNIRIGYHTFKINKHLIFYKVTESEVDIVRILHIQMDIPNRLSE